MAESGSVLTIGHSNHSPERFLNLLCQHSVEAVVDIRSAPYSRFAPHFNGNALQILLEQHDIEYIYAGKYLGGRPNDPNCYKNGVVPVGKADYLSLVDYSVVARQSWYRRGIQRLVEIAATQRTAIMCSEENPRLCHRYHLIERSLCDHGWAVVHIRNDGTLETLPSEERETKAQALAQLEFAGFPE